VLAPKTLDVLRRAGQLAAANGWHIYLVGGYVRDCLLKIPDYDIDISVEGDAPLLARRLAREVGARIEIHPGFGTAVLAFDGRDLDVVTARRERYDYPGALPTVEPGTIEDDLARRDFTINAMAVGINPDGFGPFLDPHNGLADLQNGLIRVLHNRSFLDDPTRIFRAVKLAVRLGFKIEHGTLELILQAVGDNALATVSIERITHELLLIMEEPRAGAILAELERLGVLGAIHPSLSLPNRDGPMAAAEDAPLSREERRETNLAIIAAEFAAAPEDAEALARWLRLDTPYIRLMRDSARLASVWPRLGDEALKPSEVYGLLHGLDPAALQAYTRINALAQDNVPWSRLHDYLDRLRHVKPSINGHYLREIGMTPGPVYRQLLGDLLDAKLNGELPGKEDEEMFVRQWLARRDAG
jgi:tRNA nucleotidyltransferase (CCA-adding enzyme)